MPCATIHLLLADRVLDNWRRDPASAPLDVAQPEIKSAFIHGALAPDMGFIPGVDRFISQLAHYVRPAALARALKDLAQTSADEAFAWGWATHILGDVEIHPMIGRAVGERLYGDKRRRIDAEEDVATHVSTEVGLDIAFFSRHRGVSRPPGRPHFDPNRIGHLTDALAQAYGVEWVRSKLLRSHRRAVRLSRFWPLGLQCIARGRPTFSPKAHTGSGGWLPTASLNTIARFTGERTPARGFFAADPPPGWLVREVEAVGSRRRP